MYVGKIVSIGRALDNTPLITLQIMGPSIQELQKLQAMDRLSVELKKYRKRRSLNANAYYWELVGKIMSITGDSRNRIHNMMLDQYGKLDQMEDGSLIPYCIRDDIDHLEFSYPHLKPTQKTLSKNGVLYRWYYQIKGSSEYDSKEMSDLINGIVGECKGMGIETLPPEELERMIKQYGKKKGLECADG